MDNAGKFSHGPNLFRLHPVAAGFQPIVPGGNQYVLALDPSRETPQSSRSCSGEEMRSMLFFLKMVLPIEFSQLSLKFAIYPKYINCFRELQ